VPFVIGKYKDGRYKELPHLVRHFRTKRVKVTCDKENPINLDGELRVAREAEFLLAKEKVRFFYPKGLTWKKEAVTV
jgi:diacylglycerol kinase family enzyme